MKFVITVARVTSALAVAGMLLPPTSQAIIVGPYTVDANTLHLWHLNEATPPCIDAVPTTSGGSNLVGLINGATLGTASFSGFGNALNTYDGGPSLNTQAAKDAILGLTAQATNNPVVVAYQNSTNGAFTFEAIVRIDFDPTVNYQALRAGGHMILTGEGAANGNRVFQMRIDPVGVNPSAGGYTSALGFPCIEFINVHLAVAPVENIVVPIPTNGPNAIVSNGWFHVAVTYNGQPNTANNVKVYWTAMDNSQGSANLIGAKTMVNNLPNVATSLAIGNTGRNTPNANFVGLIDEVRISNIERGPQQMMFQSANVYITLNPLNEGVDYGGSGTLTVGASSSVAMGYQWRLNSTAIPGATSAAYTFTNATTANAGNYDCVVTNINSSAATSTVAVVKVGALNFLSHRYSFTNDTSDSLGGPAGALYGNATVSGGALQLDGSAGTYLQLPSYLITNNMGMVSVEAWAHIGTQVGNWARLFDFGNTNGNNGQNYLMFSPHNVSGGIHRMELSTTVAQDADGAGVLDEGILHIVCVFDPINHRMAVYTNGILDTVNSGVSTPLANIDNFYSFVGRSLFAADAYLVASVDEFRVYNGALSSNSILQNFLIGPDTLPSEGPVQFAIQPTNYFCAATQPARFTALALGHPNISYQWYENNNPIPGATNVSVTIVTTLVDNNAQIQLWATNVVGGVTYTAASTPAVLTVVQPPNLVWQGTTDNYWNNSSLDWADQTTHATGAWASLDGVLFDDTGSSQPNVDLQQSVNPWALTVNSANNYLFMSSAQNGWLAGPGGITKQGVGILTLDVTNALAGPTLIQGGTLQIGNNDFYGGLGSGPVTNNATLTFERADNLTVGNYLTGTGSLVIAGGGTTFLTGSNDYTGLTVVEGGTLTPRNPAALGTGPAAVVVSNSAQLYLDQAVDVPAKPLALAGAGPGTGALHKGGAGTSSVGGPISLLSDATIAVDTGTTLNLSNSVTSAGSAILTLNTVGPANAYGPLSLGAGYLDKEGAGTLTLAATNNVLAGGVFVGAGTLQVGDGNPDGSLVASAVTNNAALAFNSGLDMSVTAVISGTGTLTKNDTNTLILAGANEYTGATALNAGTIVPATDTAFGTTDGNTSLAGNFGAVSRVALLGGRTIAEPFLLAGRQPAPDVSAFAAHLMNLGGTNTLAGPITSTTGGNQYNVEAAAGLLNITGSYAQASGTGVRYLNLQGAGTGLWSGPINDGTAVTTLVKRDAGLWVLAGSNGFSGTTTLSNGTLLVNGLIGAGGVTALAGSTLGGNGIILGAVTNAAGSTLAPGGVPGGIGVLTISNSLTLQPGSFTAIRLNKALGAAAEVMGMTNLNYGGTLLVTNLGGSLAAGDAFKIFDATAYAGSFTNILPAVPAAGLGWNLSTLATDGTLRVVSTVNLTPTNMTVVNIGGGQLDFSWPADHMGWHLQMQANPLTIGLSSNWVEVAGAATTNHVIVPIASTNAAVFYRMFYPH